MSATLRRLCSALTRGGPAEGDPLVALMAVLTLALAPLAYPHVLCDVALSALACLFLWRSVQGRDFAWARQAWFAAALLFWAIIVVRGIFTPHPGAAVGTGLAWIRFPVAVAAIGALLAMLPRLPALMLASYVLATAFGVFDALLEYVRGRDLFGHASVFFGSRLVGPTGKLDIGVKLGQIGMPAVALALVVAADAARPWWQRGVAVLGIALLTAAVFLSGERVVFVIYLACLGAGVWLIARVRWWKAGAFLAALVIASALVATHLPSMRPRVANTTHNIQAGVKTVYLQTPLAGLRVFRDAPWFGVGFRQYRYECPAHQPPDLPPVTCNIHPHEFWIESLAENGVLGTLPFVALIALLLAPVLRAWRGWSEAPLLGGSALAVLGHLWPVAITGSFFVNQRETVFWPLMACAAGLAALPRPARKPV
jgi:O-antigen ligase